MMKMIEKDALIEILAEMQGLCTTKAALVQNSKIWQQVKDMPTVDAVPVIRCKDCKWFSIIGYCDLLRFRIVDSYKYCAWAERKTE